MTKELVEEVALLEEIEQAGRAVMKPDEDGGLIGNCGEITQAKAKALRAILARQRNEGWNAAKDAAQALWHRHKYNGSFGEQIANLKEPE